MSKEGYYPKGLVLSGTVPETDRTPEVKFQYRPINCSESAAFENRLVVGSDIEAMTTVMYDVIIAHVKKWSLTKPGENGQGRVSVDPKNVEELQCVDPHIISEIFELLKREPKILQAPRERLLFELRWLYGLVIKNKQAVPKNDFQMVESRIAPVLRNNPTDEEVAKNL